MTEFKIGDKVKLVEESSYIWQENEDLVPVGTVLTIVEYSDDTERFCSKENMTVEIEGVGDFQERWEIVKDSENNIARPILEERKVGKLRIDLFDQGFPLAIQEIAKVLTWAKENKGYLDHDWQNIPDPEVCFSGAASRHRLKHNIQRQVDGWNMLQCVDEESNIMHLTHQATNVLMELELALRGVIK